jgi:hypothetical protein
MDPRIKEDILAVLTKTSETLKSGNFMALEELSNHTIHNASIYQDEDSISTAILVYALAKLVQRCTVQACPAPNVGGALEKAVDALHRDKDNLVHAAFAEAFDIISKQDEHLKMYVEEVLNKARVKKGSKLYEHGISVGRIADMLGITQWELYNYIGNTMIGETEEIQLSATKRLAFARSLFP